MNTAREPSYQHTQRAPLHLLLYLISAGLLMFGWLVRDEPPAVFPCLIVAGLLVLVAVMFRDLTVRDEGDSLIGQRHFRVATLGR